MTWDEYEHRLVLTALAGRKCERCSGNKWWRNAWRMPGVYVSLNVVSNCSVPLTSEPPCPLDLTDDEAKEVWEMWKSRNGGLTREWDWGTL